MSFRTYNVMLSVDYLEKQKIKEDAKRNKLSVPDYMRLRLGLPTRKKTKERPYKGDPNNAVDVEELAKEIFEAKDPSAQVNWLPISMVEARREAKRRLEAVD